MSISESFFAEFKEVLGHTRRWESFSTIVEYLSNKNRSLHIVETGCMRMLGNWGGDGQSTVVWGWLASQAGGTLTSIDISEENARTAQLHVPHAKVIAGDSIKMLPLVLANCPIDFLYLDSYDWTGTAESPLHHMGELAVAWQYLPSGCVVAVDDCISETEGKGIYVRHFFQSIGAVELVNGYVSAWIKP